VGCSRFRLSTETDDQPSFFEIVFLLDGQQHRYGCKADREKVVSEWLYYVPKTRGTKLLDRQNGNFDIAKVYKADGIAAKTRMFSCPVTSVFCLVIDDRISDRGFPVSMPPVEFSDIL
jgi:hypothetical protein